ncbi:B3 domain-containing protein Os11g0197600-like [Chenopodium quinoa]|uniref:B3 domain-containing protein Os11g0197600-like n=1 Tax=Chenopodium quinoa TaxID=63459 RepID=UPI000B791CF1|nr:B3 domain-containing protein Os11g0197600-like [Chenopodium quinoa]
MTENSFIAIMRPSCVYKRFFLNVPVEWLHKHSLRHNQEVVLHVGEKTWLTTYYPYDKGQGLGPGWKKFALENFLAEFDVLVFTPIDKKDEAAMVINVDIFRVDSTIMPLPPILS